MKTQLTKREYIGEGYYHQFKSKGTPEIKLVEISKEEYTKLAGSEGENFNPVPEEGWIYDFSFGGSLKVAGGSPFLGGKQFCIKDEFYYVADINNFGNLSVQKYTGEEFNNKFIWQ